MDTLDTLQSVAFGTLLRRARIAAGLTQEELAERAGISRRSLGDLESAEIREDSGPDGNRALPEFALPSNIEPATALQLFDPLTPL